jgi:diacylglycerol kinase (ATP)
VVAEKYPSQQMATRLAPEADHVVITYNPTAGARDAAHDVDQLVKSLRSQGFKAEVQLDLDELAERAANLLAQQRLRAVIGAGGDGTVAELLNRTPVGIPFAMLPGGTENLLSKYIGQRPGIEPVVELIRQGLVVHLDAGHLSNDLHGGGRLFMLMASCGIDADVVHRIHAQRQGHIHHLSYVKPIWESIRNYEYPELRVYFRNCQTDDSKAWQMTSARWAVVTNLPRYARGLKFAPDAVGTDGLFDLCTFRQGSLLSGLKYLSGVFLHQHQKLEDCEIVKATHIRIESDHDVPIQLDGDPCGKLPIEIEVVPRRLSLLVSSQFVAGQGIETH